MGAASALKRKADFLTALRLLGVFVIPLTWFIQGPAAVSGLGGWLLLAFWATDLFDGRLARQSGLAGNGFLGRNDGWIDLMLSLSGWTLLSLAGFINPTLYLLVALVVVGLVSLDFLAFQGPAVFLLFVFYFGTAFTQNPAILAGLAVFLVLHAIFSRERFLALYPRFLDHWKNRLS